MTISENPNVDSIDELASLVIATANRDRQIVYGTTITFTALVYDLNNNKVDVDQIYFDMFKTPLNSMTKKFALIEENEYDCGGPTNNMSDVIVGGIPSSSYSFTIDGGDPLSVYTIFTNEIIRVQEGMYSITINIPEYLVPGMYNARWQTTDSSNVLVYGLEQFFVVDPPYEPQEILDPPRSVGIIRESLNYQNMGQGLTDSILLVGHADGININDPYHVPDLQEAIDTLQADNDAPLVRGLLEAYNAGCRDIWLVAAAPTREYISDLTLRKNKRSEWGNRNFYERYAQRLEETYRILNGYDVFDVITVLEAPFYDALGVDFFTPLARLCMDTFINTGSPPVGVLGTRYETIDQSSLDNIASDSRITALHDDEYLRHAGKMMLIAFGEGVIQNSFVRQIYNGGLNTAAASFLCANALKRGLSYTLLPNVLNIKGLDLLKGQVKQLANARLNPAVRTPLGKRGAAFNIVLATDNTMAPEGSDYWSVVQMRLVSRVIKDIKGLGNRHIGSIQYPQLSNDVKIYFAGLKKADYVRDYTFNISRDKVDFGRVIIDIVLYPRFGINDISFAVEVGPERPVTMVSAYAETQPIVTDSTLASVLPDSIVIVG